MSKLLYVSVFVFSYLIGSLAVNDPRLDKDDDENEEYGDKGLNRQINNGWGTNVLKKQRLGTNVLKIHGHLCPYGQRALYT